MIILYKKFSKKLNPNTMQKTLKIVTVAFTTFFSLGFIIYFIDTKANGILTDRQREVIYRLRDSIYAERNELFNVNIKKQSIYTFKQSKLGYSTFYSIQMGENTEGVILKNPFNNEKVLQISNNALNYSKHLISYNRQGDFILDDSKIVGFASKKVFNALSESKTIKIKINDLPEANLEPLIPENPYSETYFSSISFENNGSIVLPFIDFDKLPMNVKVGSKKGIPQFLKGAYVTNERDTVFVWILNNPNYPLIVKMNSDTNIELKEISGP
jgi:hypothetical protein